MDRRPWTVDRGPWTVDCGLWTIFLQVLMNQIDDSNGYPQRSMRDFYAILFRHKWKVIVFFLAVMVTVTLGTFLTAEIYRSEAKLLVRFGRESVGLDPTATTGQTISIGQSRESEINSELEILKSRELAERVVDKIGPKAFLERPDEEIIGDPSLEGKPGPRPGKSASSSAASAKGWGASSKAPTWSPAWTTAKKPPPC